MIEMTIDADGNLTSSDIYRAMVRNRAKLAYNSVAAWLDGVAPAPARLAAVPGMEQQIRYTRWSGAGAETRTATSVVHSRWRRLKREPCSSGRMLSDLRLDERNRAKDLIEDFMVAANGVTARFLESKGFPSIRRILRTPQRWSRIVELAAQTGERLPVKPDAVALNAFLATASQTPTPPVFPTCRYL